jgi:glycosyltransferase involved in cell wall biosynthesis
MLYSPAPIKGAETAFEAIRLARQTRPEIEVVSFGAHPPRSDLPLPTRTRFQLRPPQDRLREIYGGADVWLCASVTEGFALPPLEAMACRCPAVVTRCGGPDDFMEEGRNGFTVDVGDARAMADRIIRILSDPPLWQRMSDGAYETSRRFDFGSSALRFEQALLGRATSPGPIDPPNGGAEIIASCEAREGGAYRGCSVLKDQTA